MFGLVGAQWPSRRGAPRDWLSLFTRRLCKAKRTIVGFRAKVVYFMWHRQVNAGMIPSEKVK